MDVCAKLRGLFHERRVGHGGTLDPMATGVLPVFVGRATRAVEFAEKSDKEYVAGLRLGMVTNTQDTTGEVLETHPAHISREQLEAALEKFRGDILQVPPMYSAVKIGGKKLYELARKGREVERRPRPVTVYGLELLDAAEGADYTLRIRCSKGTYVRTLCHDIGRELGCGGCMSSLRRARAAGFSIEEAVTLETVQAAADRGEAERLLTPVDAFFARSGWPEAVTAGSGAERVLRNGGTAAVPGAAGPCRVYGGSGEFLGLGEPAGDRLRLTKSFFEV